MSPKDCSMTMPQIHRIHLRLKLRQTPKNGRKEETKIDDYATQLAARMSWRAKFLTDEDGTRDWRKDMYQQMVNGTVCALLLSFKDGTGTIMAPNFQSNKMMLSLNWKTTDGKSLVISAGAGYEGLKVP